MGHVDSALSLWDRLSGVSWIERLVLLGWGGLVTYATSLNDHLQSLGLLGWLAVGLVGVLLLAVALATLGWGLSVFRDRARGHSAVTQPAGTTVNLGPLVEAFEQHAIREFQLSGAATDHPSAVVETAARLQLRDYLHNMEKACGALELTTTGQSIASALKELAGDVNWSTAYHHYRRITLALRGELERNDRIVIAAR